MAMIKRRRGVTRVDLIKVTSNLTRAAVDVTGCSFVMYITKDKAPNTIGDNLLYSVDGVIANALLGFVTFAPTEEQALQPDGVYYYEIIMTDVGGLTDSIAIGEYVYY